MFGLREDDRNVIINAIDSFDEIDRAVIFGSRAIGNYKKGSDLDIAISGENVTGRIVAELNEWLNEETPLPYFFDVLHYENLKNDNLKEHIDVEGITILEK